MHAELEEHIITIDGEEKVESRLVRRVYEQRWSAFLYAVGTLLFISPPFVHILGLTPTSVLTGLFLFRGEQSLSPKPNLFPLRYILTSPSELPTLRPQSRHPTFLGGNHMLL